MSSSKGEGDLNLVSVEDESAVQFPQKLLAEKQIEALKECDRLIQHFKREADEHKRNFRFLKRLSISLTLVVTLLSALSASKKLADWEWIVPVLSGFAALATTLLSQTNSQKNWVHSRDVQQKLQVERFRFLQDAGSYAQLEPEEKNRLFSDRVMDIWNSGHETWGQTIAERKD